MGHRRLILALLGIYAVAVVALTWGPASFPSWASDASDREIARVNEATPDTSTTQAADPSAAEPTSPSTTAAPIQRPYHRLPVPRGEDALNVLLFVPFGVLVPLAFRRLDNPGVVVAGAAASTVIELAQLFVFTWRAAQVGDVITNTLGAAVGYLALVIARGLAGAAE